MVAGTLSTEPGAELSWRRRVVIVATGCVYLLVAGAAVHGVRMFVQNPMSASMLAALAVVFVAGRAGVISEPGGPAARRRGLRAAAPVAALVVLSALASVVLGASMAVTTPTLSLLFGSAEAVALAFVLEVWLHGLPLEFARRAAVPPILAIGYAVAAGFVAVALDGQVRLAGALLTIASGTFFAGLWFRTRDAWAPVAAHFVWIWLADVVFAGEVIGLGSGAGLLSHAPNAYGPGAWVATAGFSLLSVLLFARGWPALGQATLPSPGDDASPPAGAPDRDKTTRKRKRKPKREPAGKDG